MKILQYTIGKDELLTLLFLLILSGMLSSCKRYLDAKPANNLVVPHSIADYQAMLDQTFVNNESNPSLDIVSADNYYVFFSDLNKMPLDQRKTYYWEDYDYTVLDANDWETTYNRVYYPNLVLEGIEKIEKNDQNYSSWNSVKGSALLFRAAAFLKGAWIFSKAYDISTASKDYGIVLRTTSDFNVPSERASVKETYAKIIHDLMAAVPLLPIVPQHVMRPSKTAAYAYLARTYLSMRKYDSAWKYSNLCLKLKNDLMNYNLDVDPNNITAPIKKFNKEVIFSQTILSPIQPAYVFYARIDSTLYRSYSVNDLRKDVFFLDASLIGSSGHLFRGTYSGSFSTYFIGPAVDEMYLTRAECYARLGERDKALNDLNTLMINRWTTGTFVPFAATTSKEALDIILTERRKELIFRGLRWMDIKRLNKEGANITLKRIINGQTYTLSPNDPRFALPLPKDIIDMTGMPQNPR